MKSECVLDADIHPGVPTALVSQRITGYCASSSRCTSLTSSAGKCRDSILFSTCLLPVVADARDPFSYSTLTNYAMSEVIKAGLLAGAAELFVMTVEPPPRATTTKQPVYRGQPFELVVRYLAYLGCFFVSLSALCHAILILSHDEGDWVKAAVPWICPSNAHNLEPLAGFSARFVAGLTLVAVGTAIRSWSFRALGPLFTFELVIKDDHRLVTSGPYRYVRHPAYTGMALILLGTHLILFGEGGFITHCNIDSTPAAVFVYLWKLCAPFTLVSLCRRCGTEDAQLRQHFGADWEEYQRKVPYVLVPFVY
ncbi:hypothetical protein NUW54_g11879 [Trametes sanguinea]|uniref:Uncharacterized protein n=1 Tax=Trametes sanguinea TaxID=158606 RepID=A0ACC1N5G9_9APHY|nr:hypothetical protein NUW54_g11879 [Trametes sanguinea]